MKKANYIVNRDDIHVGNVICIRNMDSFKFEIYPNGIYFLLPGVDFKIERESQPRHFDQRPMIELKKNEDVSYDLLRRMFFVLDENNHARNNILYAEGEGWTDPSDTLNMKIFFSDPSNRRRNVNHYIEFKILEKVLPASVIGKLKKEDKEYRLDGALYYIGDNQENK